MKFIFSTLLVLFSLSAFAQIIAPQSADKKHVDKKKSSLYSQSYDDFYGDDSDFEPCSQKPKHDWLLENSTDYAEGIENARRLLAESPSYGSRATYTIPVVFHVIHEGEAVGSGTNISDAQLLTAIDALNRDYAATSEDGGIAQSTHPDAAGNTNIQFCLASSDPSGNPTDGINRVDGTVVAGYAADGITNANEVDIKDLSRWDNRYYLNIWVVTQIDGNGANVANEDNFGGGTLGYAYYPTNPVTNNADRDGIVALNLAVGNDPDDSEGFRLWFATMTSRTLTHEVGHYLNLIHTFEGGSCTEGDCATEGDLCCDTPPTIQNTDCANPACGGTQQVENYLDYTGENCYELFSNDQAQRMTDVLTNIRTDIHQTSNCTPPNNWDAGISAIVSPAAEECGDTFDPIVTLKNYGANTLTSLDINYSINGGTVQTYNWTGSLGSNSSEDVTLPTVTAQGGTNTFNATTVSGTLEGTNTDEDTSNDGSSKSFDVVLGGNEVTLTITTDDYGFETAWRIIDGGGTTVYDGGNVEIIPGGQQIQTDTDGDAYGNNVTVTQNFCLTDDCYDFEIHDDWGDGICCDFGNGSYLLEDDATGTTLASGGDFGDSETTNFCVPISTLTVTNTPNDITISCEDSTDPANTGELTANTTCSTGGLVIDYTDNVAAGSCADESVITRTWTASDDCGSVETYDQTITVVDNTNPTGTAPADATVQCIGDVPAADPTLITDEADNCATPTVTHVGDASDGNVCPEVITRTYRIEDNCGNFIDVTQTITVDDNINPTGTAPADATVQCFGDVPAADPTLITDEADNCTAPTVTHVGDASDGNTCPEVITRTYRIEDDCGNFIEVDQLITINDDTDPTASNPATVSVQCDTDIPAPDVTVVTDETDNCTTPLVTHVGDVSDANTCPETITRTYRVEDDCGNFIEVNQTIIVDDDTAPTGTAPADATVQCIGDVPAADPTLITDEADNCATPTVTHEGDASDGNICPEVITRTYRIEDDCGNFIEVDQLITINDDTDPTASNPATVSVQCDTDIPAPDVTVVTDETDNCTTPIVTHVGDVSDANTCPETITRTYRIEDNCGNFIEVNQTIIVDDDTAPTGTAPDDIQVQCAGDIPAPDPALITDEADNCTANPTVSHLTDVSDGSTCPETITRTYRIEDDCGNFTDVDQLIIINDDTDPTASNPAAVVVECDTDVPSPDVTVVTDEADNCTAVPTVTHVGDASDNNVCNGEVITRTYRVEDDCGNFIEVNQTITIDAYTPIFTVVGTDPTACGEIDGFITISGLYPNTDYEMEYDGNAATTITTDGAGEHTITGLGSGSYTGFTVSDADCPSCSTTDGSTITLTDPNAPSVNAGLDQEVCEGSTVTLTADNPDGAIISWDNGVTDGVAFTPSVGTTTYTVTADDAGCINTDQVEITVAPTIDALTCPGGLTAVCDITEQSAYADFDAFIADGGSATIPAGGVIDSTSFTLLSEVTDGNTCPETVTRTYEIADTCGVTVTCTQDIVINDNTSPIITCSEATDTILASEGSTMPDYTPSTTASDNCTANPSINQTPSAGSTLSLGTTIVTMTTMDECGNQSTCTIEVTYEDDASIEENELSSMSFYPNPTTNILNIDFGLKLKEASIVLYDAKGRLITEKDGYNQSGMTIDLSSLAKGMYTVIVHSKNGTTTQKVSKM